MTDLFINLFIEMVIVFHKKLKKIFILHKVRYYQYNRIFTMSYNNQLTNFECVGQFHEVFGHPKPITLQKNILEENPKLAQFRLSLIQEEFNELKTAVSENNMTEVIDALGDILYVVYGMGQAFGIDLDKVFKIVH